MHTDNSYHQWPELTFVSSIHFKSKSIRKFLWLHDHNNCIKVLCSHACSFYLYRLLYQVCFDISVKNFMFYVLEDNIPNATINSRIYLLFWSRLYVVSYRFICCCEGKKYGQLSKAMYIFSYNMCNVA